MVLLQKSKSLGLAAALLSLTTLAFVRAALPWPTAPNNTLRPIFHVPADGTVRGYVGDANGMMYRRVPWDSGTDEGGLFHLFWQCFVPCNPDGPLDPAAKACNGSNTDTHELWWCHAVSEDHVRWRQLPPAIGPGAESGGVAQLDDGDVVALFHDFGGGGHWQARPRNRSDPLLARWALTLPNGTVCAGLPSGWVPAPAPGTPPCSDSRGIPGTDLMGGFQLAGNNASTWHLVANRADGGGTTGTVMQADSTDRLASWRAKSP